MAKLCLHLGMSKTATTWLQKEVFPRLLGDGFHDNPPTQVLAGGPWQGGLARAFRRSPQIWRHQGSTLLRELLGQPGATEIARRDALVSDQSAGPRLLEYGTYVGPHWEQERMDPVMLCAHLGRMREVALAEGFAALKAIIVIRRQDTWLASKYAQRSDRIAGASQRDFEARITYYLDEVRGYYADGIILDYLYLWEQMVAALGQENVMMIPYESLERDPSDFLRRLTQFQGARAWNGAALDDLAADVASRRTNVRSTAPDVWQLRPPQRAALMRSLQHRGGVTRVLGKLTARSRTIRLTGPLRHLILGTYRHSNHAVGARIGHNLEELGYLG